MLRVGLTGGIGTGKSRILSRFVAAGWHTLDLDSVAHALMEPGGRAYGPVVEAFGTTILAGDGRIDRAVLGRVVFGDAEARGRLNAIVHPLVREEERRQTAVHASEAGAVVVVDAALLVEAGVHLRFDRLVVAHCRPEQQAERLEARDGMASEDAWRRIRAQMPSGQKRRFAHFEVDTSGEREQTDRAADEVAQRLGQLARERRQRVAVPIDRMLACLANGPTEGPRGLTPALLLREIVTTGGLELTRLAQRLEPPASGPWYEAAAGARPNRRPETLAGPLVAWSVAGSAPDTAFLLSAAASLARLTHAEDAAVSDACHFARVLQETALALGRPADLGRKLPQWRSEAERWGGAPCSGRIEAVVAAALAEEPASGLEDEDSGLVAALAALAGRPPAGVAHPSLRADLLALNQL